MLTLILLLHLIIKVYYSLCIKQKTRNICRFEEKKRDGSGRLSTSQCGPVHVDSSKGKLSFCFFTVGPYGEINISLGLFLRVFAALIYCRFVLCFYSSRMSRGLNIWCPCMSWVPNTCLTWSHWTLNACWYWWGGWECSEMQSGLLNYHGVLVHRIGTGMFPWASLLIASKWSSSGQKSSVGILDGSHCRALRAKGT